MLPRPRQHPTWSAGLQRTKAEVVKVVHVGVGTIATRLRELAGTDAGLLTYTQLRVRSGWVAGGP